jgi:tetratricopeptide (TPR) repeat protein
MTDELKEKGLEQFRRGEREQALATFTAAADAYAAADNETGRGEMLNNIGVIQRINRNWPEAIAALTEAQGLFAAAGDLDRQAQALGNLGDMYAANGEEQLAIQSYSDSAELFARAGEKAKESQVLWALSLYHLRQRHVAQAMMIMDRSYAVHPHPNIFQRLFQALIRFALALFNRPA